MDKIFETIQKIGIKISNEIKFTDLSYTDHHNATGDTQLKLDVLADEILTKEFSNLDCIKALVSEEKEDFLNLNENGKYIIAYDPLDGSSLVDVNLSVGSIFGIYEGEIKPQNMVASAYIVYGPRLEMVFCEDEPKLYRLNKNNEFDFVRVLKLNEQGKLNATGGTQKNWPDNHRNFVRSLFDLGYRLRYSGAMVADLHQILLKGGGLFSYPATSDAPNGKLRVTFEVLPFAYIFERANGLTTDGKNDSLFDIKIEKIHQSTPCFFGSKFEIKKLLDYEK